MAVRAWSRKFFIMIVDKKLVSALISKKLFHFDVSRNTEFL